MAELDQCVGSPGCRLTEHISSRSMTIWTLKVSELEPLIDVEVKSSEFFFFVFCFSFFSPSAQDGLSCATGTLVGQTNLNIEKKKELKLGTGY